MLKVLLAFVPGTRECEAGRCRPAREPHDVVGLKANRHTKPKTMESVKSLKMLTDP